MKRSRFQYGGAKNQKLAHLFGSRGANIEVSKGSNGAADLRVRFSTGTKWVIRVKSSRRGNVSSLSSRDIGRLNRVATRSKATPVIAEVSRKGIKYVSARTHRRLAPPRG